MRVNADQYIVFIEVSEQNKLLVDIFFLISAWQRRTTFCTPTVSKQGETTSVTSQPHTCAAGFKIKMRTQSQSECHRTETRHCCWGARPASPSANLNVKMLSSYCTFYFIHWKPGILTTASLDSWQQSKQNYNILCSVYNMWTIYTVKPLCRVVIKFSFLFPSHQVPVDLQLLRRWAEA